MVTDAQLRPALQEDATPGQAQIGSFQIMEAILRRKKVILIIALLGALVGLMLAFLTPPSYTARATFLPPPTPSSASSALLGQLGQLGALAGASGTSALKDPTLVYVGILESRTVADELIRQFNLQQVYKTPKLSATEKALAQHTKFIPGKNTLRSGLRIWLTPTSRCWPNRMTAWRSPKPVREGPSLNGSSNTRRTCWLMRK